jgi:hypothetical protein
MKRTLPVAALCIAATAFSYSAAIAQVAPQPTPSPTPSPAATSCHKFNPRELVATKGQSSPFILESEGFVIGTFASLKDAETAKRVAAHSDTECLIGISSQLSRQYQYVDEYFEGSGPGGPWPDPEDCESYKPADLTTQEISGAYYLLSGNYDVSTFATAPDAERALLVAKDHSKFCFVGRKDSGGNAQYVMTYFH